MLYDAALVIEGGGMRGNYATGITDTFIRHDIEFRHVIGVSAGALCAANFVSKQYGRMIHVNTSFRHNKNYIALRHFFRRGAKMINLDFLFQDHGFDWRNFDERAYRRSASNLYIVASQLGTGKPVTFTNPTGTQLVDDLKASSSIPFFVDPQPTSAGLCLDGSTVNPIPYNVAVDLGTKKVVIIRNAPHDFHSKPRSRLVKQMYHHFYKDYPDFVKTSLNRPQIYNHQVDTVNQKTADGEWFTFAPDHVIKIAHLENNTNKINHLYRQGRAQGEKQLPAMLKYLKDPDLQSKCNTGN